MTSTAPAVNVVEFTRRSGRFPSGDRNVIVHATPPEPLTAAASERVTCTAKMPVPGAVSAASTSAAVDTPRVPLGALS